MAKWWNKIKEIFQPEVDTQDTSSDEIDLSYDKPIPTDEKFASYFSQAGGHFLYCENKKESLVNIQNIVKTEKIGRCVCFDRELQAMLNTVGINFINYPSATADCCFLTCESLIAYNGSIMMSSDKTNGRKLSELPETYIILAHHNQIVENLSEAMQILNRTKMDKLPSGITSLGGVDANPMDNQPSTKTIYLLLLD